MKLTPEATKVIYKAKDFSEVRLLESDIEELCARVRFTHHLEIANAIHAQRQAKELIDGQGSMITDKIKQIEPLLESSASTLEVHTWLVKEMEKERLASMQIREKMVDINRNQGIIIVLIN